MAIQEVFRELVIAKDINPPTVIQLKDCSCLFMRVTDKDGNLFATNSLGALCPLYQVVQSCGILGGKHSRGIDESHPTYFEPNREVFPLVSSEVFEVRHGRLIFVTKKHIGKDQQDFGLRTAKGHTKLFQ